MGHADAETLRREDNDKRERLRILREHIGLPFDQPFQCLATDVANKTPLFLQYLEARGDELCAMRLIPLDPALPKLRMRGKSVRDVAMTWFPDQDINPEKYRVDFIPHPTTHRWSTIFIVNQSGVFGEIIQDSHEQLTQGFYRERPPIAFSFDWNDWRMSADDPDALLEMQETFALLHVPDREMRNNLAQAMGAAFAHDYLCGYFESVNTDDFGRWFIDYNRLLGKNFAAPPVARGGLGTVHGQCGSSGRALGRVRIVAQAEVSHAPFENGDILVCDMTSPDFLPLMQKAAAIITDRGGILSHAAIVCRELGTPCVVGTGDATTVLRNGDTVEVDAENGVVRKVERS